MYGDGNVRLARSRFGAVCMRHISTGDAATDHNLQRLDHLASLDRYDPEPNWMQDWLVAVIYSLEALPQAVRENFHGFYYLGDSHYKMTAARRAARWKELVEGLKQDVEAAYNDPSLRLTSNAEPPDLSDRRQTKGERILALCDRADKVSWGTAEFDGILSLIGGEAVDGIGGDVTELKRLIKRKRIPDLNQHRYWIHHHLMHIRSIASRLHHLP